MAISDLYHDLFTDTYGSEPMSRFGVDYSFSRPSMSELKAAGVTFACRYIGTPSSGKNLTQAEADQLHAAGIDIVANFEAANAGWMQGGRQAGIDAARAANSNTTQLGMPADRPIYFSADYNATYDQYKTQIKPCLEGAATVIGRNRVGIYGGLEQVDWAFADGVATWVWQTYAWSYGMWSKHAHIQQYRNGQKLGSSSTVDYDRAMVDDFGQWGTGNGGAIIVDANDKQYFDSKFANLMNAVTGTGTNLKNILTTAINAARDDVKAAIVADPAVPVDGPGVDAVLDALAARLQQ